MASIGCRRNPAVKHLTGSTSFYDIAGKNSLYRHFVSGQHAQESSDQVLAESFQLIVDAGQLRLAAERQHGIIIPQDGEFPGDIVSGFSGVFYGGQGQHIIRGYDPLKEQALFLHLFQIELKLNLLNNWQHYYPKTYLTRYFYLYIYFLQY